MSRALKFALLLLAPVAVFAAMVGVDRMYGASSKGYDYVARVELPPSSQKLGLPEIQGPADASRPLVVIDAGHGGHDPGAAADGVNEKALTLLMAQALRDELLARGGVRVALTRNDDKFLALEERSGIARALKADLFLSIHADSASDSSAKGASVYTLSSKGSNDLAARMAERENRADVVNGVSLGSTSDAVSAILIDLSQRESLARSEEFAGLLVREGQGRLGFRDQPLQSASFVVLKSPDVPSVLVESGYMSNSLDTARLLSAQGRAAFAQATAQAIRVYLARQSES